MEMDRFSGLTPTPAGIHTGFIEWPISREGSPFSPRLCSMNQGLNLKFRRRRLLVEGMTVLLASLACLRADVMVNEIMYHPSSENVLEEYIELHNRGATNVN